MNVADITFVTCIEAGDIEEMTCRLLKSLRQHGGKYANAPFFAAIPRPGLNLSKSTVKHFDKYQGRIISSKHSHLYSWHHFFNKPKALLAAERETETPYLCFLDSDMLITNSLDNILPTEENIDFFSCPREQSFETENQNSPVEVFRKKVAQGLNIPLESFPKTMSSGDKKEIYIHFNAGFFVYRKESGYAQTFMNLFEEVLKKGLLDKTFGTYVVAEFIMCFTIVKKNLSWKPLPPRYNAPIISWAPSKYRPEFFRDVTILHYHSAMQKKYWPLFIKCMRQEQPQVAEWLEALGSLPNPSLLKRLGLFYYRILRVLQRKYYFYRNP